ncbi:MarR family winged helix-turn-helix transcriptional regulator [Ramlibacter sp. MMS24-I3-19]|uniref:MarR family winged helix-turn-helix transcriptional regulator n=1 Tax=Ramlibacter sp. MMS24-I3-19 TaxID=3416606 RepID=UPI003D01CF4D
MSARTPRPDKQEMVARARFRHQLRLFERFTEEACVEAGITMPQYMLLLQVAGRPERDWALIGELAECLVLRHHTAVELTSRCEVAGLVARERDEADQRKVRVRLTPAGRRIVERIARAHSQELQQLLDHMGQALARERPSLKVPAVRKGGSAA